MTSKDIFKLAVRLLGLGFLYHGLIGLPVAIPLFFSSAASNSFAAVLMFGWPLLVSYWLLRGAPLLVRIAYPEAGERS
jgi:hypothetical protein